MSGGSFDYLSMVGDLEELLQRRTALHEMADALDTWSPSAYSETRKIIEMLDEFETQLMERIQPLRAVWHAMEWYTSADWGRDDLLAAIREYLHHLMDSP